MDAKAEIVVTVTFTPLESGILDDIMENGANDTTQGQFVKNYRETVSKAIREFSNAHSADTSRPAK